jgi:hypothetical protein
VQSKKIAYTLFGLFEFDANIVDSSHQKLLLIDLVQHLAIEKESQRVENHVVSQEHEISGPRLELFKLPVVLI